MPQEPVVTTLSQLGAAASGVFRAEAAADVGVTRNQLTRLAAQGIVERVLPRTYRMTAVSSSAAQRLRVAMMWAGPMAAAAGRSAGELYRLEGVRAAVPEIVVPRDVRARTSYAVVSHGDPVALMARTVNGFRATGIECTVLRLAHLLEPEAFEIACEDARRRRLTTVPALHAYLDRFGRHGRPGVASLRRLLADLDPKHPSRSTLEVKTRRLLVAHGITGFVREFPLEWNGRTYCYDFVFPVERVILETNGRRWHDDATDYEHDHEKWSVPGRHGYRIVFATWDKVTRRADELLGELATTLAAAYDTRRADPARASRTIPYTSQ